MHSKSKFGGGWGDCGFRFGPNVLEIIGEGGEYLEGDLKYWSEVQEKKPRGYVSSLGQIPVIEAKWTREGARERCG